MAAGVGCTDGALAAGLGGRRWLQELAAGWVAGVGCTGCRSWLHWLQVGWQELAAKTDISSVAYKTPCIFYREGMILGVVKPIQLTTWLNL